MLNYIKGEGYRITHSRGMYVAAGIASGLLVLMNLVLYISNQNITNFPYGLMSFSLNNLIANLQILFISGFVVAALLFGDERRTWWLMGFQGYIFLSENVLSVSPQLSAVWQLSWSFTWEVPICCWVVPRPSLWERWQGESERQCPVPSRL